jgi:hypothetical protein
MNETTQNLTDDRQDRDGFYIPPEECLFCGCCHREAPNNIVWADLGFKTDTSYILRQPESQEEIKGLVSAASVCMCDCIYYGGDGPDILAQIAKNNETASEL